MAYHQVCTSEWPHNIDFEIERSISQPTGIGLYHQHLTLEVEASQQEAGEYGFGGYSLVSCLRSHHSRTAIEQLTDSQQLQGHNPEGY